MPTETQPLLGGGGWLQAGIAGAGFLADAYDLFVIDLVLHLLDEQQPLQAWDKSLIASGTLLGAICGQLLFGFLADYTGRRGTFLLTCVILVVAAAGSATVQRGWAVPLPQQLAAWRFLLGIGIGGEYPLSAAIAKESGETPAQGLRMTAMVFSMQGWGMLLSCAVVLGLLQVVEVELAWRLALGFGAVAPACVLLSRARAAETKAFEQVRAQGGADAGTASEHLSRTWELLCAHRGPLLGTALSWLLLDVTFYGLGSFKTHVAGELFPGASAERGAAAVWDEAVFAMGCALVAIPGYLCCVLVVEQTGWYRLQLGGFLVLAAVYAACAVALDVGADPRWAAAFFALSFFVCNAGPNSTTFIAPTQLFPTEVLSACHGLSAASGKVGAVIGAAAFAPFERDHGLGAVLWSCAAVAILGAAATLLARDNVAAKRS